MTPHRLDGEALKFNKGDFLAGKDGVVVPIGTKLVAIMDSLAVGWIKWHGGKPVDYRMGLVVDGFTPRRSELDEHSSDGWEVGTDGDLRDPWAFTNTLAMINPSTEAISTFNTNSRGGIGAVGELCKAHAKEQAKQQAKGSPGTYPLVRLEVGSYQHQDRSIGRVKFPIFNPVEFVPAQSFDALLAASRGETAAIEEATPIASKPMIEATTAPAVVDEAEAMADAGAYAGFDPANYEPDFGP